MSLHCFLDVILLVILSMTQSVTDGAGTITISVTPASIKEFTGFTLRCQYPTPAVNTSTTGVIQVTHLTSSADVIYTYDFDANSETISSAIKKRASAALNRTAALVVLDVQVAYASDAGRYICSLTDANANTSLTATPVSLNVTGCVGGSQLDRIIGCPSLSIGQSCSILCSSNIINASVSISKNINGSPQIASDLTAVNYTISSLQSSDFGDYFCYVRTDKCISMANTSITQAPVTTSPPSDGCVGGGGCGGRRLPGWGIALIVIACVIVVVIIIAIVIFVLYKKGIIRREKETGVQPTSGGQGRNVSNDNYAMSRAKSAGGKKDQNGKSSAEPNNSSAAVVSFPEVKSRKSQLPPLEPITQGWNRRQTEDSSPDVASRRPLPKRAAREAREENGGSPAAEERSRRRSSQTGGARRESVDDSPERGRLPPIRISSHRERDEDEEEEEEGPRRF